MGDGRSNRHSANIITQSVHLCLHVQLWVACALFPNNPSSLSAACLPLSLPLYIANDCVTCIEEFFEEGTGCNLFTLGPADRHQTACCCIVCASSSCMYIHNNGNEHRSPQFSKTMAEEKRDNKLVRLIAISLCISLSSVCSMFV